MNDVEFEKLLSYKVKDKLCLRDAVFDYYCKMLKDDKLANDTTKLFTDELYKQFVNRKA